MVNVLSDLVGLLGVQQVQVEPPGVRHQRLDLGAREGRGQRTHVLELVPDLDVLDEVAGHRLAVLAARHAPQLVLHAAAHKHVPLMEQNPAEAVVVTPAGTLNIVDFARKVVGVGSVGTEAHIALLIGSRGDDALWLQMKEASDSVLERYTVSDLFKHQGERVVFGQRLMQASSDTFLGWASSPTRQKKRVDFYVRQLNDYKASANIAKMDESRLSNYVEVCAEALARAHARSGSATAISGYLGKGKAFDKAVGSFAVAYADQNESDYGAFAAAAEEGAVEVERGV